MKNKKIKIITTLILILGITATIFFYASNVTKAQWRPTEAWKPTVNSRYKIMADEKYDPYSVTGHIHSQSKPFDTAVCGEGIVINIGTETNPIRNSLICLVEERSYL